MSELSPAAKSITAILTAVGLVGGSGVTYIFKQSDVKILTAELRDQRKATSSCVAKLEACNATGDRTAHDCSDALQKSMSAEAKFREQSNQCTDRIGRLDDRRVELLSIICSHHQLYRQYQLMCENAKLRPIPDDVPVERPPRILMPGFEFDQ